MVAANLDCTAAILKSSSKLRSAVFKTYSSYLIFYSSESHKNNTDELRIVFKVINSGHTRKNNKQCY